MRALMSKTDSSSISTADWELQPGEALRLTVGPGPRELQVLEGRVWLTRDGLPGRPALDVWLEAGETLALESGMKLVMEGWPQARFQLLVPPRACAAKRTPVQRSLPRALGVMGVA